MFTFEVASQYYVGLRRCGLLMLQTRSTSVCRSVTLWTLQTLLNRLTWGLACGLGWAQGSTIRWGAHWRHLANTSESSMCGGDAASLSNYYDHLFCFSSQQYAKLPIRVILLLYFSCDFRVFLHMPPINICIIGLSTSIHDLRPVYSCSDAWRLILTNFDVLPSVRC